MILPPPDKLLHNWLKQSASRFQLIESLPRLGGGWSANQSRACVKSIGVKFGNDRKRVSSYD
jgi:hypothetical protein